ncbi:unnamed protein product [Nippostrongylus brasiliensis]|uniref:Uncharacterized protein n=1 Tax=Nippostrongylus brasiliensis TaxID=27835 RepID=A0A0N4YVF4_NIPBR|nr:unnamed protein product [Nippostrongylus brasiliensis]
MVNGTNGCADCDLRASDVLEMQQELERLRLSTSSKEKNEENKNLIEQLRAEIKDKTEEIEKNQQTMRALTSARSAAEEINVSLQETVTSLSEQLYRITSEKEKLDIAKEKVDYLYEEMRAKVEDLTRRLEAKENDRFFSKIFDFPKSNLTQNAEIDRLTAVSRSLNEQLQRIESEHKNAVNDLKMMNENQTQFIEVLTRKVEQFKEDKAQWLLEKSSLVDEIAALKDSGSSKACTDDEVKAYKTRIDELSNQVEL